MAVAGSYRIGLTAVGIAALLMALGTGGLRAADGRAARSSASRSAAASRSPAAGRPTAAGRRTAACWRAAARGPAAEPKRRGHGSRPPEHEGSARHQDAPSRSERERVRAESRQLRRGAGEPVSQPARGPDVEERPQGRQRRHVVEAAPSRDRRRVRSRGARPGPEERAQGDVAGQSHRAIRGRRTAGRRPGTDRRGGQLAVSGDHRRDPDDARDAGQRGAAGAGDDDVRRTLRHAPRARHSARARARLRSGTRRRARRSGRRSCDPVGSSRDRAADRRRLGLCLDRARQHPGRQRRRPHERHHRPRQQG